MMFFQFVLLAGYLYAHILHRYRLRTQALLHFLLIGGGVFLLAWQTMQWPGPIKPDVQLFERLHFPPVMTVVILLGVSVGLPFLILSANSTLLQAWFTRVQPKRNAYALYALSNAASLLALLSYPLVLENHFPLSTQSWLWAGSFLLYGLCMVGVGIGASRVESSAGTDVGTHPPKGSEPRAGQEAATKSCEAAGRTVSGAERVSMGRIFSWVGLSFVASAYLLAVTNELTQDISPTPFLWLLPLGLYLLTFVLAFSERMDPFRAWTLPGALAGAVAAVYVLFNGLALSIYASVVLLLISLFTVALFCQSVLYTIRPAPRRLTLFYVMISLGGGLGGAFISLLAPVVFPAFWDIQVLIFLAAVASVFFVFSSEAGPWRKARYVVLGGALALIFPLAQTIQKESRSSIFHTRNFYGSMRVEHEERGAGEQVIHRYQLMHGNIAHGIQFSRTRFRNKPTAYYHEESGVGRAILHHPRRNEAGRPFRIGVIGEGIGTIASYCREQDSVRFYELNPAVHELAAHSPWFTYLADCRGTNDVVLGDGRLSLERELNDPAAPLFDVLVLDAFSSDAIPVHLLTREAFEIYLQRLEPENGILAFHATNKFLNFLPLGRAIANHFGFSWCAVATPGDGKITLPCLWLLFSRNPAALKQKVFEKDSLNLGAVEPVRLWTDDYSSLFDLLIVR